MRNLYKIQEKNYVKSQISKGGLNNNKLINGLNT